MTRAAELAWIMQAQERLMTITDTAAGTGNLKKGAYRQHHRRLRRQARGPVQPAGDQPLTRSAAPVTAEAVRAMGVEVVVV